eukprot:6491654-Amphidinium_carterae.2
MQLTLEQIQTNLSILLSKNDKIHQTITSHTQFIDQQGDLNTQLQQHMEQLNKTTADIHNSIATNTTAHDSLAEHQEKTNSQMQSTIEQLYLSTAELQSLFTDYAEPHSQAASTKPGDDNIQRNATIPSGIQTKELPELDLEPEPNSPNTPKTPTHDKPLTTDCYMTTLNTIDSTHTPDKQSQKPLSQRLGASFNDALLAFRRHRPLAHTPDFHSQHNTQEEQAGKPTTANDDAEKPPNTPKTTQKERTDPKELPGKKRGPGRPKGNKTNHEPTQKPQAQTHHRTNSPPCNHQVSTATTDIKYTTVPLLIDDDDSEPDDQQQPLLQSGPDQKQTDDEQNDDDQQVQDFRLEDAEREDIVSLSPEL